MPSRCRSEVLSAKCGRCGRYVPADVMNIEGALYFCTFFMARSPVSSLCHVS